MRIVGVWTTVASREDARRIGRALVERRLAACVQITAIESVYTWKGAVQQEDEFRLLVKTTEAAIEAVEAAIRELHPYELPSICAVAFDRVDARYAEWVAQGSAGA